MLFRSLSVIGSFNLNSHCADTEDEDIVIVNSEEIATILIQGIESDLTHARKFALETYSPLRSSVIHGITGRIVQ